MTITATAPPVPESLPELVITDPALVRHVARDAQLALLRGGMVVSMWTLAEPLWSITAPDADETVDDALYLLRQVRHGLHIPEFAQELLSGATHITREILPGTVRGTGWGFDLERWTVYVAPGVSAELYLAVHSGGLQNRATFVSAAEAEYREAAGPFAPYPPEPASDDDW